MDIASLQKKEGLEKYLNFFKNGMLHFIKIKDIRKSKNCSKRNKNTWNMPISTTHVLKENIKKDKASVHKTVSKRKNTELIVREK